VNLVDSSAWLEYFTGGPQAAPFTSVIEAVNELIVPTIVVLEVSLRILQQRGDNEVLQVASVLHQGRVVALDAGLALSAAQLGIAHKLPMADSIILATARQFSATIWTMDADFDGLPDVRFFAKQK